MTFKPFEDEEVTSVSGGLAFLNGPEQILVDSGWGIYKDRASLDECKEVIRHLQIIIDVLEAEADLPEISPYLMNIPRDR